MRSHSRYISQIALLSAVGIVVFIFESLLSRPLPWVKPGLANITTLLALYLLGFRASLAVVFLRVTVGALILGTIMGPVYWLSLGSGIGAAAAMGFFKTVFPNKFSIIGLSLWGAVTHNILQLWLAYLMIVRNLQLFILLPWVLFPAIFSGLLVGILSFYLYISICKQQ